MVLGGMAPKAFGSYLHKFKILNSFYSGVVDFGQYLLIQASDESFINSIRSEMSIFLVEGLVLICKPYFVFRVFR